MREEEFEKWWSHANENSSCQEITAKWVWSNAWTAAKLGQLDRAKEEVHTEIRAKLLNLAVEIFKEGDTQRAQIIRDLADTRHSLWTSYT